MIGNEAITWDLRTIAVAFQFLAHGWAGVEYAFLPN
jgi:hypothetical protein